MSNACATPALVSTGAMSPNSLIDFEPAWCHQLVKSSEQVKHVVRVRQNVQGAQQQQV